MAQTLKLGKNWATKKGSLLAYNDESDNFKPLPFETTRSSTATRVNQKGLIEVVENDRPRIDYTDSEDGVLLLEKASTNLITYSEDFSQSVWAKSGNAVVDSNFTTSPSGKQNASKFTFDGTTNATVNRTISVTNGVAYTFSVWLKNNNLSDPSKVWIGLSTTTQGEYVTVTNEWQRFDTTHTSNGTLEYPRVQTSEVGSIFAWAAMLEQSSHATSYIPTQGSAVTRVADTASGAGNSEVFNSTQGVLFTNIAALANDLSERRFGISDGGSGNVVRVGYTGVSNRIIAVIYNGSNQAVLTYTSPDITQNSKIAVKYKANDFALWVDGVKRSTDISGVTFAAGTLNSLDFNIGGGNHFYSKTKEVGYYDTALTDLELEKLTSYVSLSEMATELNYKAL